MNKPQQVKHLTNMYSILIKLHTLQNVQKIDQRNEKQKTKIPSKLKIKRKNRNSIHLNLNYKKQLD